jgi:RNA recognition motif-containing protein
LTPLDDLIEYFEAYGEILEAKIIVNKKTNMSKGYGFVTLGSRSLFERLKEIKHVLDGRCLDLNIACKKSEAPEDVKNRAKRILYVGGLPENMNDRKCSIFTTFFKRKIERLFFFFWESQKSLYVLRSEDEIGQR